MHLDSLKLKRGVDYVIENSTGRVTIKLKRDIDFKNKEVDIYIQYNFLPFSFQPSYRHKNYSIRRDSINHQATIVTTNVSPLSDIFGNELQKSGSIFRGFSVGSNRDLTLNSGFRLQFAGKLSSDVEILAALTDENTPIQPEGNTQTLQELDKVFVEVKGTNYEATLGDFYLDLVGSEFGRLSRKLQGAKGTAYYSTAALSNSGTVIGATSRGKFNTNQFAGIEGVQGPYRLFGKNNERNIIVIAGTEKVYVDGNLMLRGETNDYAIDYASCEIVFSSKRLITSASRIVVDFQYSDRAYTRNFFAVQSTSQTIYDDVKLSILYAREGDDPNAPIDLSLTDSDKKILQQSGSTTATKSGVVPVGVDSLNLGKGQYAAVDTSLQGKNVRLYRFSPGTPEAQFNVAFSFVGGGQGDYIRESLGRYRYVGSHNGQYDTIVILPSPQLQQLADVNTSIRIMKNFSIEGEYAGSSYDANRFSVGDDRTGAAMKLLAHYTPANVKIGRNDIGSFDFSLSDRYVNKNFISIDRSDDVEFGRKWSLDSTVTVQPASEEIREARMAYNPLQTVSIGGSLGSNRRGNQFSADRMDAFIQMNADSLPKGDYTIEQITSSQNTSVGKNVWLRQRGTISYALRTITPSFRFESEKRTIETGSIDSLNASSFGFTTVAPKVSATGIYGMNVSAEFELRDDRSPIDGRLHPQSRSLTQAYNWSLPEIANFSSGANVILRKKMYNGTFRLTNGDVQTILLRSQSRYAPFQRGVDADVFYEVSTQRSAKLERIFYQVRKGDGQYVWTDSIHNGRVDVADERDFRLSRFDGDYIIVTIPSDELYPVIDLKTSTRLRFTPSRFINSPSSWSEKALAVVSTESYVRIEEKSSMTDTKKIYLLDFSRFLQPATTILGSQLLQQDFFLFENRSDFSFRFRYQQRRGLGQYSSGLEQSYSRERSIRVRLQLVTEISNQLEYINKQDNVAASVNSARSRMIASDGLSSDYSYRPEQNVEVGFKIEVSRSEDAYPTTPVAANFNSQSLRTAISFQNAGQVRIDFSREEILLENAPAGLLIPFELTGGREDGKTFLWGVTFDYRLSGNLQSSLQYTGRSEQFRRPIHTARAEVRAFF